MPLYQTRLGPRDRTRINLSSHHEVQYWVEQLEVDEDSLRAAVEAVGDRVVEVRTHLAMQAAKAKTRALRARR
jgi:hypothetical protein